jgi:hypothetical protein
MRKSSGKIHFQTRGAPLKQPCSKKEARLIDAYANSGNYPKHKQKPRRAGKAFTQSKFQLTTTF